MTNHPTITPLRKLDAAGLLMLFVRIYFDSITISVIGNMSLVLKNEDWDFSRTCEDFEKRKSMEDVLLFEIPVPGKALLE